MSSAAYAAETVGMPQLDPKSWVPQIFWLILTFGFLYVVIAKIVYPRLSESIEQRNDYISDLVDEAKKLTEQTDKLNKQYEDFIKDSPWIQEYKRELDSLRDRYARGENKKKLSGLMEVYPRPTYKASIKTFIHNPNATTISTVDPEPEPEPEPVQEEMKAMEDDEKIAIEALLNLR